MLISSLLSDPLTRISFCLLEWSVMANLLIKIVLWSHLLDITLSQKYRNPQQRLINLSWLWERLLSLEVKLLKERRNRARLMWVNFLCNCKDLRRLSRKTSFCALKRITLRRCYRSWFSLECPTKWWRVASSKRKRQISSSLFNFTKIKPKAANSNKANIKLFKNRAQKLSFQQGIGRLTEFCCSVLEFKWSKLSPIKLNNQPT